MDVLKKISGATLMETLVATVLIVVVFMVSSGVMNSLFLSTVLNSDQRVRQELAQLTYLYQNKQLSLPYYSEYESWEIAIVTINTHNDKEQIYFSAKHLETNKEVTLTLDYEPQ